MTNVPQDIRDMWADIYRLFDLHYNMDNTAEAWKKFWDQAGELQEKYKNPHLLGMVMVVSDMIEYHIIDKKLHPCTLEDMKLF